MAMVAIQELVFIQGQLQQEREMQIASLVLVANLATKVNERVSEREGGAGH